MSYRFFYSDASVYGHVVSLVDGLELNGGVVLDIGCGFGAVAEPLKSRGFEYIGIDFDKESIDDLHERGFEAHQHNMFELTEPLPALLGRIAAGRKVTVVLALDFIEHCAFTTGFLEGLREAMDPLGNPRLVVSIPNVAHLDLAARLLAGEFTYTPTGLLDATHVRLWTGGSVAETFDRLGWTEVGANDFEMEHSDQHDPQHPLLTRTSLAGEWIHSLRSSVDAFGFTYQFVRAFEVNADATKTDALEPSKESEPFLSVVMRTEGARPGELREALLCLAAQSDDDFEVAVVAHHADENVVREIRDVIASFGSHFSNRVSVIQAVGSGRAHPLNVGINYATGTHVAFLDDDDLVTADWVEVFRRGASECPGRIIRSFAVVQDVRSTDPEDPHTPCGPFDSRFAVAFDYMQSLDANQTPIHTVAVPRRAIDLFSLRFDESLPVLENWDFVMRVAALIGVHETNVVTAVYHRWVDGAGTADAVGQEVWDETSERILGNLLSQPILVEASQARREHTIRAAARKAGVPAGIAIDADASRGAASTDMLAVLTELGDLRTRLGAIESSKIWKLTKPLRVAVRVVRFSGRILKRSVRDPRWVARTLKHIARHPRSVVGRLKRSARDPQ